MGTKGELINISKHEGWRGKGVNGTILQQGLRFQWSQYLKIDCGFSHLETLAIW